ncbi:methyltransferase [Sphingomonas sp. S1-29]|uniref:methyltransferase n=1 Tax=Sphingomonas sp. S1-29 TaxID=2991074 RepID=UPI00223F44A4|nr:methyltransferase [Sphingomonas sp. S1-29]UZK69534.1 methyltransferase [Sphingomonas sp. S1-29]
MKDGWREGFIARRNRVLASPRFQRFAARSWLTRRVARGKASALFDLVAGFVYSQTLSAFLEAGMLDRLAAGPVSLDALAARADLPAEATARLLRAAATLDLVEPLAGDRWVLGGAGAALLGNRGIVEMVAHHRLLYADLADPLALLRKGGGGALGGYWHYAGASGEGDAAEVAGYSALMAASQPLVADQVIDSYRFAEHRRILDVGGGEGAFALQLARRVAGPALAMFDLPAVAARATARFEAAGVADRIAAHGGDFIAGPLPNGHDCITLIRILHDHDDAPALQLLRNIHAALPPGGVLVIGEPMADAPGAKRMGDAYFGWYLLAMGSGRPRTAAEIISMAKTAGFLAARSVSTALPLTTGMVVARR